MAPDPTQRRPQINGDAARPAPPIELAFTLPTSPDTRVHLQITNMANALTVFLASSNAGAAPGTAPLSSLVYALPNVRSLLFARRLG